MVAETRRSSLYSLGSTDMVQTDTPNMVREFATRGQDPTGPGHPWLSRSAQTQKRGARTRPMLYALRLRPATLQKRKRGSLTMVGASWT